MTALVNGRTVSAGRRAPTLAETLRQGSLRTVIKATDPDTPEGRQGLLLMSADVQAQVFTKMQRWRWLQPFWLWSTWLVFGVPVILAGLVALAVSLLPASELFLPLGMLGLSTAVGLLGSFAYTRQVCHRYRLLVREPSRWLMPAVLSQRSPRAGAYLRIVQSNRERLWVADAMALERIAGEQLKGHVETWAWHTLRGSGHTTFEAPISVVPASNINT